ncbi:HK97 family phage prohead protease [Mesorhizobium sp. M1076]
MAGLFVERFARGSFDKSLLHNPDVAALWSHDSSRPLGCVGRRDSKYRSGRSTSWLKIKSYMVEEYDLLGVEREPGKPAFALMADRKTGQYVGSAFIQLAWRNTGPALEARPEHAGPAPKGMKRPATQWVGPGVKLRIKHLRGEHKYTARFAAWLRRRSGASGKLRARLSKSRNGRRAFSAQ